MFSKTPNQAPVRIFFERMLAAPTAIPLDVFKERVGFNVLNPTETAAYAASGLHTSAMRHDKAALNNGKITINSSDGKVFSLWTATPRRK
jgi:hypothetical protein